MGFLSNMFGKKKFNNDIQTFQNQGNADSIYGGDVFRQAIGSLDTLDSDYQKRLASGLPDDVKRAYDVQQGRISDEQTRGNSAFAANLVQRAKATGGAITPEAALDAQVENQSNTATSVFNARNSLAADEASKSLDYTQKILDAIERVRTAKLGAGYQEQALGADIYKSALDITQRRRAATQAAVASIYGSYSHAAAGGGGGG